MSEVTIDAVRNIFGGMLRNAQALEAIMRQLDLTLPDSDTAVYAASLQQIGALTIQHAAQIQEMRLALGIDRRQLERRSGTDRRGRP